MAQITINLDKNFENKLEELKSKYGEEITRINGFAKEQLDYTNFIDNFIDNSGSVADVTIDSSANVSQEKEQKDVAVLLSEMNKPHMKLLSFNKIYYEIEKEFGKERADEWLECEFSGLLYMHDAHSTSFYSYCYAYELKRLAEEGLYFLPKSNVDPAKHLTTFMAHLREFIVYVSNRSAGACALPSFFIYTWYFWNKDVQNGYYLKDPEYYRKQAFQQFVFEVNQIHTRIIQSAYTNLIIMDRNYIEEIFGDRVFPDGTYVIDHVEEIIEHQKVYMETESEIREKLNLTFPVYSYSLLYQDGKFVDDEFARWAIRQNMKWFDSNIYMGDSVTSLASCCFHENQPMVAKIGNKIIYDTIGNIINKHRFNRNFRVLSNGKWEKAKPVKIRLKNSDMLKITTTNNKVIIVTKDHELPVLNGDSSVDIMAKYLCANDYIEMNSDALHDYDEYKYNADCDYSDGFVVGLCAEYGATKKPNYDDILQTIYDKYSERLEKFFSIRSVKAIFTGHYTNDMVKKLINKWTTKSRNDISFNMEALSESTFFRRGIINGLIAVHADKKGNIISNSRGLIYSAEAILTSLGEITNITEKDLKYTLKTYKHNGISEYRNLYKTLPNGKEFYKIKSIDTVLTNSKYCYCFEMEDHGNPYFVLPNGVVTHNCRMRNDVAKQKEREGRRQKQFQSSIGGSLVEIGSVKVSTVNLMRIALMSNKDKDKFIEILTDTINLNMDVLDRVRHIVKRNIEKKLLPNYSYELINLDKQTVTNGLTAMYEAIEYMGLTEKDEFGNVSYSKEGLDFAIKIMDTVNALQDKHNETHDYDVSLEIVPGESANAKLCAKDNIIFGRNEKFIYSNQWTSLMEKSSIDQRTSLAAVLDRKAGGGQILHITTGTNKITFEQCWEIVNDMARKGVIYAAFNPELSICEDGHTFWGDTCPICGKPKSDTVTRIVGYLVPMSAYSAARYKEANARYKYQLEHIGNDVTL